MFYLLLILGLVCSAIGVFVVGFGVPIRDTPFGSALLVAGSVAITGGLVTVGLAAMMAELRLVVQALKARLPPVSRPPQPVEPKEADRRTAAAPPIRPIGDAPPSSAPGAVPETAAQGPRRPEWLRRAFADPQPPVAAGPTPEGRAEVGRTARIAEAPARNLSPLANVRPAPDNAAGQPDRPSASAASNKFDRPWPAGRTPAAGELSPPERRGPALQPGRQGDARPAPAPEPPAEAPSPQGEVRPASILKSGVIDEMSYTLFTDGSIEAQMPEGTVRFGSIEELRQHLENQSG